MDDDLKNLPLWSVVLGVIILGIVLVFLISYGLNLNEEVKQEQATQEHEVGNLVIDYINNVIFLGAGEVRASLVSVSEESGLYRIEIKIEEDQFPVYATKDGRYFFPEFHPMKEDSQEIISEDEIGQVVVDYFQEMFLLYDPDFYEDYSVDLVSVSNESGVYKLTINELGEEFNAYVSQDGRYLFFEFFDMQEEFIAEF